MENTDFSISNFTAFKLHRFLFLVLFSFLTLSQLLLSVYLVCGLKLAFLFNFFSLLNVNKVLLRQCNRCAQLY